MKDTTSRGTTKARRQGLLLLFKRNTKKRGGVIKSSRRQSRVTSPYCDTIGIINHGQLIACEKTPDLLGRLDSKQMVITVDQDLDAVPTALTAFATELRDARVLQISFPPSRVNAGQVLAAVSDAGLNVVDVVTREADLEDIFVNLTHADNMAGTVQAST